jgi:hypothetical protein
VPAAPELDSIEADEDEGEPEEAVAPAAAEV